MSFIGQVGFIGLGTMGYSMAGWLSKQYDVMVFNRTADKAVKWLDQHKGQRVKDMSEVFESCDAVFLCVGEDNDLRSILIDGGAFSLMKPGSYLIDHTTASKDVALEIGKAAKLKQIYFFDAPVSGGEIGAKNGLLTVMLGGDKTAYDKIQPLLDCYSKKHELIGPNGHGQLAKMVNQVALAGLIQALSEAINFGQMTGIAMDKVLDSISKGAAQSWQMDNRSQTMLEDSFDFGFANQWMAKDLEICIKEAASNNCRLPITKDILSNYKKLIANGYGGLDTSSLIKLLRDH